MPDFFLWYSLRLYFIFFSQRGREGEGRGGTSICFLTCLPPRHMLCTEIKPATIQFTVCQSTTAQPSWAHPHTHPVWPLSCYNGRQKTHGPQWVAYSSLLTNRGLGKPSQGLEYLYVILSPPKFNVLLLIRNLMDNVIDLILHSSNEAREKVIKKIIGKKKYSTNL